MTAHRERNVTVLGGLPLVACYTVEPAQRSVGIMSARVDDLWLVDRNGRRAQWAERRMTDGDWEGLRMLLEEGLE